MTSATLSNTSDGVGDRDAPGQDRPLPSYAGMMVLYGASVAAAAALVRRRGPPCRRSPPATSS